MRLTGLLFFAFLLFGLRQGASAQPVADNTTGGLRISVLTCSPGPEVWETFGHACIRVIDSSKTNGERDVIYNYGFFETSEENTIWHQVFTGRVIDLLDTVTYDELMYEYNIKKRGLTEQVLLLDDAEKRKINDYLKNNLKKENRYYEFDTFYDNCTTRIRDLFRKVFGQAFVFGQALPPDSRLTFRDVTVTPLCPAQHKYWFGIAVNLLYASPTDHVMSQDEALFSPAYLSKALSGATLNGKLVCAPPQVIRPLAVDWGANVNMPFLLVGAISLIAVAVTFMPVPVWARHLGQAPVLLLSGLAGCLLLYIAGVDGEPAWKNNFNLLWALPANVLVPFLTGRVRRYYGLVALVLLFIAFIVNVLRIQQMPMVELVPLWFALILVFGSYARA